MNEMIYISTIVTNSRKSIHHNWITFFFYRKKTVFRCQFKHFFFFFWEKQFLLIELFKLSSYLLTTRLCFICFCNAQIHLKNLLFFRKWQNYIFPNSIFIYNSIETCTISFLRHLCQLNWIDTNWRNIIQQVQVTRTTDKFMIITERNDAIVSINKCTFQDKWLEYAVLI